MRIERFVFCNLFCLDVIVQVTKLCDLGIDDLVCSVGWAQRGTHLAVGTSNGKVQVRVYGFI